MYQFLRFIFQCLLNLFFRYFCLIFSEIVYRNKHKIPKHLPTIFVIAPHHNQFVDPLMVITASDRPIGFLAAAKSMRRLVVGFFSRALKAIPVERGQDLVFKGSGQVMFNSETGLTGFNTKFTTELEPRFTLTIESITVEIVEIISDTKLVIKEVELEFSALIDRKISYKVTPYINQHDMFKSVIERLKTNGCVGIFPEGGSHDRSEFLPLKAGVSIMALAAMSENPNLNVQIVPVGLSYFHADRLYCFLI